MPPGDVNPSDWVDLDLQMAWRSVIIARNFIATGFNIDLRSERLSELQSTCIRFTSSSTNSLYELVNCSSMNELISQPHALIITICYCMHDVITRLSSRAGGLECALQGRIRLRAAVAGLSVVRVCSRSIPDSAATRTLCRRRTATVTSADETYQV